MKFALLVAASCMWVSLAGPASAAARFTLEYAAPLGCPSREAFLEAVRERVPEAEESELEGHFAFRVTIEAEGDLVRGRVVLGPGVPAREVTPAPCADVASSMALMIAIVLAGETRDPETGNAAEATSAAPAAATAPKAPAAPNATPERTAPLDEKPELAPRPVEAAAPPTRSAGASNARVSVRGGLWAAGGLSDGVAPFPAAAVSGGAELEVEWFVGWKPSARAGVSYAAGDASVEGRGNAEFRWSGFAGRLCPHTFALARRWSLAACASLEVGELTARGLSTPNGREQRMPWLAVGVAPRAELALGHVVSLEAELGLRGIVRHDRFVFEPDATVVYDVPRFAPQLALGVNARFP